jgi:hypothetical protein
VGRISLGSSLNLAMLKTLSRTVRDIMATGSFADLDGFSYSELNAYFAGR